MQRDTRIVCFPVYKKKLIKMIFYWLESSRIPNNVSCLLTFHKSSNIRIMNLQNQILNSRIPSNLKCYTRGEVKGRSIPSPSINHLRSFSTRARTLETWRTSSSHFTTIPNLFTTSRTCASVQEHVMGNVHCSIWLKSD